MDEADLGCVREATTDPRIPEWTTVPVAFTAKEGLAFIRRQWGRADSGRRADAVVFSRITHDL